MLLKNKRRKKFVLIPVYFVKIKIKENGEFPASPYSTGTCQMKGKTNEELEI